jgi:hypothetical protein
MPQILTDTVMAWVAWGDLPPTTVAATGAPFQAPMTAGVMLSPSRWDPPYDSAISDLAALHAGTVFISPLWYLGANAPLPEIRYLPEQASPLRQDVLTQIDTFHAARFKYGLAPEVTALSGTTSDWWGTATRDTAWWDSFFQSYSDFLYTYADIAQQTGTDDLFVVRANILSAMPGQPGTPGDADTRWRVLVRNVRLRFAGKIAVELSLTDAFTPPPAFLDEVDEIFIRVSGPLTGWTNTPDEMKSAAGSLLDGKLADVRNFGKPIFLEAAYASDAGSDAGCPLDQTGACLPMDTLLTGPGPALTLTPDFDAQARAYQALLAAAAERNWISGFFSWGYYAPAAMRDASASIRGKPAETLLGAWFNR